MVIKFNGFANDLWGSWYWVLLHLVWNDGDIEVERHNVDTIGGGGMVNGFLSNVLARFIGHSNEYLNIKSILGEVIFMVACKMWLNCRAFYIFYVGEYFFSEHWVYSCNSALYLNYVWSGFHFFFLILNFAESIYFQIDLIWMQCCNWFKQYSTEYSTPLNILMNDW